MKRLYTKCLLLFALSVCSVIANAQTLSVESIEANTGEQAELVVSASGMSGVTALQFNLALPQSVTLNVSAITKGSAVSSHELKVEKKTNGEYLFVLYHLDLGLLSDGTLLKLPITTGQQSGTLGGSLNTIRTASADATSNNCVDASYNVTVKAPVVPVTITANNLTMVYGDDVPTLTYTSEGGALNGTPKLSTTATKTSPVGTYPIKVEKGTVTNEAVTYIAGTLTITQAPLTVGVQNVTITEGDAIPSFTLTYSGFRNGDTESNAFTTKPTATTTATSSSKAGTYPITVSGGSATNYALTYTQGTLTITEKPVEPATVTANSLTMVYGDDVPTLTYTSEGGALNGTPKLSTTATKTSPVGTYPIKVEKGTVTNEAVTYIAGTLTITQAPLTVGVQNVTITEGDAIPSFTLTYSGFRNGDTEANAFTTKPTATTTATSSSKAGTYPITVSGGTATNYSLTYTQGTLTIKEKDVILGDLNDDGSVSITDVVLIIDVIAGSITDPKKVKAADVNKDGYVTITDCVAAIDLIAAQTKGVRMNRASAMPVSNDFISASMQNNLLTVNLNNENRYTAFQMVVTMPDGMTIDKAVIDELRGTGHQLTVRNLGNGQYLLAGFSMGNSELAGNSGRLLTIGTKGQTKGDIIISDIEFATAEAEAYRLVPITISNAATGIYQIKDREWKRDDAIFDLQGRQVNQPTHGLYIKNGKLIIVK